MTTDEVLIKYFRKTGFDGIELYISSDYKLWTCCIIEGGQGQPKPTINEAILSALEGALG